MMFDLPRDESPIIKVIGVGGGGSNAVTHMYNQGIVGVDFAICNTDSQAMDISPVPSKIQLGPNLTEGRGAGSKPDVGKRACEESIEEVKQYLTNNCKMLFITAGMGGGTGTGAAPIIAKTAQEMGILTVGIVTLPFTFEGRRRTSQGMQGLAELKSSVDTLIVVSNDKLRQIHGNLSLSDAFSQADDILSTAAKGIAEIITVPGYVNVDFEDVNTVMRASGVAIMGTASAEGDDRAKRAVDDALHSPLLEDNDIRGAQHILLNITSGNKEVTMDEIFEITEFVQEEAGYGTDLIWGNCFDEKLGDKISVTVIATGFEHKHRHTAQSAKDKKIIKILTSLIMFAIPSNAISATAIPMRNHTSKMTRRPARKKIRERCTSGS
jgi:cell division protein FtsZ